jgi:hypothetical protein
MLNMTAKANKQGSGMTSEAAFEQAVVADLAALQSVLPATAGTVDAGKVLVANSNKDVSGVRNLTLTGTLTVGATVGAVSQAILMEDFTDGGSTSGYLDLTAKVPAGAVVLGWKAVVLEATKVDDDTTAVITVGKAGATGAFSADTAQSLATAGTKGSAAVAATGFCATETTVRVTVTGTADFTDIQEGDGACTITVFYTQIG